MTLQAFIVFAIVMAIGLAEAMPAKDDGQWKSRKQTEKARGKRQRPAYAPAPAVAVAPVPYEPVSAPLNVVSNQVLTSFDKL